MVIVPGAVSLCNIRASICLISVVWLGLDAIEGFGVGLRLPSGKNDLPGGYSLPDNHPLGAPFKGEKMIRSFCSWLQVLSRITSYLLRFHPKPVNTFLRNEYGNLQGKLVFCFRFGYPRTKSHRPSKTWMCACLAGSSCRIKGSIPRISRIVRGFGAFSFYSTVETTKRKGNENGYLELG